MDSYLALTLKIFIDSGLLEVTFTLVQFSLHCQSQKLDLTVPCF